MEDQDPDEKAPSYLNIGIPELDDQHQAFFLHVVALRKALIGGLGGRDRLMRTLNYIDTFIADHFTSEERYMRLHNYPGILLHRAEHEAFAKDFGGLKKKVLDFEARGEVTSFLAVELEHRLEKWLSDHIRTIDQKMADYIRERS